MNHRCIDTVTLAANCALEHPALHVSPGAPAHIAVFGAIAGTTKQDSDPPLPSTVRRRISWRDLGRAPSGPEALWGETIQNAA